MSTTAFSMFQRKPLAMLGLAAAGAVCLAAVGARAATVSFALPLNENVVEAYNSTTNTFYTSNSLDLGNESLVTDTAAAKLGGTGTDMPDSGYFAVTNSQSSTSPVFNSVKTLGGNGFTVSLGGQAGEYSQLAFDQTVGNGPSTVTATLKYAGGATSTFSYTADDWGNQNGPTTTGAVSGSFATYTNSNGQIVQLTKMNRFVIGSNPPSLDTGHLNFFSIYRYTVKIDATKVLDGISETSTAGALNTFGITGTAVPEPATLGILGFGAVGLLRRKRRA